MNCSKCNAAVPPDVKFCISCGARVEQLSPPQSKFCSNCGTAAQLSAKFCMACGSAFLATEQAHPSAVEVPSPPTEPVSRPTEKSEPQSQNVADPNAPLKSPIAELSSSEKTVLQPGLRPWQVGAIAAVAAIALVFGARHLAKSPDQSTAGTSAQTSPSVPPAQSKGELTIPVVQVGESYESVRQKMLAAGWIPFRSPSADVCHGEDPRCKGRPEMEACSGTGLAPCRFLWKGGKKILAIVTAGITEKGDAVFNGMKEEEGHSKTIDAPTPTQDGLAADGYRSFFSKVSATLSIEDQKVIYESLGLQQGQDQNSFSSSGCPPATFTVELRDLNSDGTPEVFVLGGNSCMSGMTGQSIWLFIKTNGKYTKNLDFPAAGYAIVDEKSLGFPDLRFGGTGFCEAVWRWNGTVYAHHTNVPTADGGCAGRG